MIVTESHWRSCVLWLPDISLCISLHITHTQCESLHTIPIQCEPLHITATQSELPHTTPTQCEPLHTTPTQCKLLHTTHPQCELLLWILFRASFWTPLATVCLSPLFLLSLHQHLVALILLWGIAKFLLRNFINNQHDGSLHSHNYSRV